MFALAPTGRNSKLNSTWRTGRSISLKIDLSREMAGISCSFNPVSFSTVNQWISALA